MKGLSTNIQYVSSVRYHYSIHTEQPVAQLQDYNVHCLYYEQLVIMIQHTLTGTVLYTYMYIHVPLL